MKFRVEELFLDSKSGAFQLEESKIRDRKALEHLYLVVALALLFSTVHGMTIQIKGLRQRADPHWKRGAARTRRSSSQPLTGQTALAGWSDGLRRLTTGRLEGFHTKVATYSNLWLCSAKILNLVLHLQRLSDDTMMLFGLVGLTRLNAPLFSFLKMCQAVRFYSSILIVTAGT